MDKGKPAVFILSQILLIIHYGLEGQICNCRSRQHELRILLEGRQSYLNSKATNMVADTKGSMISSTWPQWLAAIEVSMLTVSSGFMFGWSSPYLALLTSDESPLEVTETEASWVAALLNLGRVFGAIFGGVSLEFFGTKSTLIIAGIFPITAWTFTIVADAVWWLYAARLIVGAAIGMIFASFPMYLGEISDPSVRSALVGLAMNGFTTGTFIGNLMGSYVSMAEFAYISLALNLLYLVCFLLIPQSPYYLMKVGKMEESKKAIEWYHRSGNSEAEMEVVVNFIKNSPKQNFTERLKEMNEPKNRKAFSLIIVLFFYMQICGTNTVIFYMEIILTNGKLSVIDPSTLVIIVNGVPPFLGILTMYTIERFGKKLLLCVSSMIGTIYLTTLGTHFMLLNLGYDSEDLQWLLILSIFLFESIYLGIVQVPSAILSEVFPPNLKPVAGFVGSILAATIAFIATKTYQPMVDVMGEAYVFWIYGIILLTCVAYSLFILPETKGKTLQEIRDML